jgi:ankyrin repeat protein
LNLHTLILDVQAFISSSIVNINFYLTQPENSFMDSLTKTHISTRNGGNANTVCTADVSINHFNCHLKENNHEGCAHGLYISAAQGLASVTKQLIVARCNIDVQQTGGTTPLHIAAKNGYAAVTEQLIKAQR